MPPPIATCAPHCRCASDCSTNRTRTSLPAWPTFAILEVATGKYADAARDARQAKEIYAAALSPTHWTTAVAAGAEGAALTGLGDYPHAEKLLRDSDAILSKDPAALAAYRSLIRSYLDNLHSQEQRHEPGTTGRLLPAVAQAAGT